MIRKYTFLLLICLPFISMGQSVLSLSVAGYDAKCNGSTTGSAMAIAAGGTAPYSYLWSSGAAATDSISGLAAGTYSVTVTDSAGNTASAAIIIHQPDSLLVSIGSIIVRPCFRTTGAVCGCGNTLWAIVSGGTPPYSYLWSPAGSTGDSTGDTLHAACYEEFTVKVTDQNNCISNDSIDVEVPAASGGSTTSVGQLNGTSAILTYPNPANNQLNISIGPSAAGITYLAVYNIAGQRLWQQAISGNESLYTIDVSGFAEGNYLLKITSGNTSETTHFSILR